MLLAALAGACGPSQSESERARGRRIDSEPPSQSANTSTADAPPISTAHESGVAPQQAPGAGQAGAPTSSIGHAPTGATGATTASAETGVDTSKYDSKIEAAEAKAKRAGAGEAERRAAAEALFERGYFFYGSQNPRLYKYALGDFRRVLRYQPNHAEAKELIAQLERIYRDMGRPIPTNGLEP